MRDEQRLQSAVRILSARANRNVVGLGFVVGARHIMTCAHVVGSALGGRKDWIEAPAPRREEQVLIEFLADPSRPPARAFVKVWHAEVQASDRSVSPEDIAVLELARGFEMPPTAKSVCAAPVVESALMVRAFGQKDRIPGRSIKGEIAENVERRRWELVATEDDFAVDPGCSGTALWSPAYGGVVGMIVEIQQKRAALFIPIDVLAEVWPLESAVDGTSQAGAQADAASRSLGLRLLDRLYACDREDHEAEFDQVVDNVWGKRRRPVLCLYGAIEPDLPAMFRDRVIEGPLRLRLKGKAKRFEIRPLKWPTHDSRSLSRHLDQLKGHLRGAFGAASSEPSDLASAYNDGPWAWLFYSEVSHRAFTADQVKLLRAWHAFLRRIGRLELNKPLAHLVVVRLDDVVANPRDDASEATLRDAFAAALPDQALGDISYLPPLGRLTPDDVSIWGSNISEELRLDPPTVRRLGTDARVSLSPTGWARLNDVDIWARNQTGA